VITGNDIRKNTILKLDGELYTVLDFQHVKPGKGGAFVKAKLRNLDKGNLLDTSFRATEKIEDVALEYKNFNFSYIDGDYYVFMDNETFEQMEVHKSIIGDDISFLIEGMNTDIALHEGKIVQIMLPPHVNLEVTYTEPGLRGDTATSATKPAKLETGLEVQVPLFVDQGDKVKVDTRTGAYVERVKE
jgi:elongation factor P